MRPFPPLLVAAAALALGAGCGPRPGAPRPGAGPTTARDSVFIAGQATMPPDLIRDGDLTLGGGAAMQTITVGELALLQAETEAQLAAAQRAVDSGMSLGDPARVLRLASAEHGGGGRAAAPVRLDLDRPFTAEVVFRLTPNEGPGRCRGTGVCDHVSVSLYVVSTPDGGGRRMPSSVGVELTGPRGRPDTARLLLGHGNDLSSTVAEVDLESRAWGGLAHRLRVEYAPGRLRVLLGGEEVLAGDVLLGGPPATPSLHATALLDAPGVTVVAWRIEQD